MNLGDLLTPWIELALVLIALIYVEKWIHSHLYGVGLLLSDDKKTATALYYLLLSPGVFVHEFTQYLVAGALNVKIKRVMAWPEAQDDGTLRLNFVQIKQANRAQAALLGAAPLLVGLGLIWVISNHILNLEALLTALGTGNIEAIGPALRQLGSTPDFYLWLYLMFAIGNAMLPTSADREGWPLFLGILAVVIAFLVLIGTGDVLWQKFTGPVAHGVRLLTTAFGAVLVVEVFGIVLIAFAEEILERTTGRKFYYGKTQEEPRSKTRQPGSSDPLPADAPLPSIYNLPLPIPSPTDTKLTRRPPARQTFSTEAPAVPRTGPSQTRVLSAPTAPGDRLTPTPSPAPVRSPAFGSTRPIPADDESAGDQPSAAPRFGTRPPMDRPAETATISPARPSPFGGPRPASAAGADDEPPPAAPRFGTRPPLDRPAETATTGPARPSPFGGPRPGPSSAGADDEPPPAAPRFGTRPPLDRPAETATTGPARPSPFGGPRPSADNPGDQASAAPRFGARPPVGGDVPARPAAPGAPRPGFQPRSPSPLMRQDADEEDEAKDTGDDVELIPFDDA